MMTATPQQRAPTTLVLAPELGLKPAHAGHGIPTAATPARSIAGTVSGLFRPSQVPVGRSQIVALQRDCACEGGGAPCSCPSEGAGEQEEAAPAENTVSAGNTAQAQKTVQAVRGRASTPALPGAPGPEVLAVLNDGGQALDPTTRAEMESRLGDDFSSVRVHTGPTAAGSAAAVQARAFTVGNDIVFGAGSFAPGTGEGRRILAHELVHVQQQRRGPVSGTSVGGGMSLSDPADRFEREAERLASAALSRTPRPVRPSSVPASPTSARSAPASVARAPVPVQRQDVPLDEDLPLPQDVPLDEDLLLPTDARAGGPGASQEEIAGPPPRDESVALSAISEPARTAPVNAPVVQRWSVLPANSSLNTVVCDGTGGLRVQLGGTGNADQTRCLSDCMRRHEESHLADAVAANPDICKSKPAGGVIGATAGAQQKATEFKASNVEIACLEGKRAAADATCRPIITARITQMKAFRDRFKP